MPLKNNRLMFVVVIIVLLACVGIIGWSNRSQAAAKTVWEYKFINSSDQNSHPYMGDPERGLNKLGAEGWELVQFNPHDGTYWSGVWIFRRAK